MTKLEAEPIAEFDVVHADILRLFPDLVVDLGGDADALLRHVGIDPSHLARRHQRIGYRLIVDLLEHAATTLSCPDFGMRLAALQGSTRILGPLGAVMRNSKTFGEALEYVRKHAYAHSLAARVRLRRNPDDRSMFVGHHILLDRLPNRTQSMEQLLLLGHLNAIEMTGGQARVRQVYFRHQPLSAPATYRRYFGCEVAFDQQEDGVLFFDRDLLSPIVGPEVKAYETATSFIKAHFTRVSPPMHAQVRGVIHQLIGTEDCSNKRVAAELNLHPRTLHRRLAAEGRSFHEIRDQVRRDVALYYLRQTELDLTRIAQKLGYAEHSVLSRSCTRWFSAAPRDLRARVDR